MNLTLDERTKIFDKLCRLVATKHFSPGMNGVDWTALAQGGREIRPPDDLTFSVGDSANLLIEKLHGGQQKVKVQLPMPKSQKHPVTAPEAMHTERLSYEIGLLKVAMFPGAIGIAVAKDIDLRNRCTRRMQPTHGGSARQHRWRNWRAAPDELSHAWKTRSGLQPHAGTP